MTDRAQWTAHGLVVLATAVVFVIDLQTSWGVATWILYALPMFLLCYASGVRYLVPFAALVSALIVLDHFLSGPQAPLLFSVFNRTAGLVTLWVAVWLIVQRDRKSLALQRLAETLEAKVAERTESLEAANAALSGTVQALRESEERFRLLFELSPVGIGISDQERRLTAVNKVAADMFGYRAEEMIGMAAVELTHPEDRERELALVRRLRAGEFPRFSTEVRYLKKDGRAFWGELTATTVRDPDGRFVCAVGMVQDVTERKESERQRIEAVERQRDALLREVHHRIKNNLQGVVGLFEQHAREHPEMAEPMRAAIARVNSMAAVHGLHAAGDGSAVRLCHLVDAIGEYERGVFPEVGLRIERPRDWRELQLDEREAIAVALVLNELTLNAIKACLRESCAIPVTIAFARDAEGVRVAVSNAVGRLPEGFDFAAARGLGTGLTLAKSLLPPEGARLAIRQLEPVGVEAELRLASPVTIER
jgi:PAS domain S-box-containing protein